MRHVTPSSIVIGELVRLVHFRACDSPTRNRHTKMCPDFFQSGSFQARLLARRGHPLNPTSPLFNQLKLVENPSDDPVPQLRDALHNILDRQPERQKTGILDLDPVIKKSKSDGRSLLRVVGMNDGIHDRLANCHRRNRPAVLPANAPAWLLGAVRQVAAQFAVLFVDVLEQPSLERLHRFDAWPRVPLTGKQPRTERLVGGLVPGRLGVLR